jgi:C1A family cysteine protease
MDNAFKWIENNNGLCIETDYPYVSGNGVVPTCVTTCDEVKGSGIVKFYDVKPSDDNAMMTAISKQPVSIAIEADQREFQLYKSGVFTGTCGTNLDHGVLVVGYGSMDGNDYYLVKNSWSQSWGDDGYIKLGRGSSYNNGNGQCGILLQGSYPVL